MRAASEMVWRLRRLGVVGADDHGEGVFEAERRLDADVVARGVEGADGGEDAGGVALAGRRERLLEDRGERGAGVFDVGVDAAADEGLLADVAAGEVEAAVDSLWAGLRLRRRLRSPGRRVRRGRPAR